MSDVETDSAAAEGWRLRPLILSIVGAIAAVIVQQLLDKKGFTTSPLFEVETWRIALAAAVGVGAGAYCFAVERARALWSLVFSLAVGVVAGLVFYWNGSGWDVWYDWHTASAFLAIAISVPLFQTARDHGGWRFAYPDVHGHAWTNVVLWCACWLFVDVVFALAWLLASLFDLIGLHFLRDLLDNNWFTALLFGGSFGAVLGLLRARDGVVRLLRRVVTAVLAVLAPALGVGLVVFLCSLPFTGLAALWQATKSTTPILLSCVIGAVILVNAVIGDGSDEEATNPALRWGAAALAVAMLPLTLIAALATSLRIQQYGYSPDRLWALAFVMLATVYAAAYFGSVMRRRLAWPVPVRDANLKLAFVVCGVALLLATPLLGFNAISTRDQVARLTRGKVTPEKFDWAALALDFGEPGRAAVKRLAKSANRKAAERARDAAAADSRWALVRTNTVGDGADALARRVRILPRPVPLPDGLLLSFSQGAHEQGAAEQRYEAGSDSAVLVTTPCDRCAPSVAVGRRNASGSWRSQEVYSMLNPAAPTSRTASERRNLGEALAKDGFDLRNVQRRQVFVAGKPIGDPFE